jgi:hypothetical protein
VGRGTGGCPTWGQASLALSGETKNRGSLRGDRGPGTDPWSGYVVTLARTSDPILRTSGPPGHTRTHHRTAQAVCLAHILPAAEGVGVHCCGSIRAQLRVAQALARNRPDDPGGHPDSVPEAFGVASRESRRPASRRLNSWRTTLAPLSPPTAAPRIGRQRQLSRNLPGLAGSAKVRLDSRP